MDDQQLKDEIKKLEERIDKLEGKRIFQMDIMPQAVKSRHLSLIDGLDVDTIRELTSGSGVTIDSTKIGFFGETAVAQQSYTAVSNPPTQAQVTAIRTALINLGLMASS